MIRILQNNQIIASCEGDDALVAALLDKAGAYQDAPCGGRGKCGKCRVRVLGDVSAPTEAERAALSEQMLRRGVRLACQARIVGQNAAVYLDDARAINGALYGAFGNGAFRPWGKRLGLAADIGTTTVAFYLFDLLDGRSLGASLIENPQRAYGADVVSRISYALGGGKQALMDAVRRCIAENADALCKESGRDPAEIDAAVITGNTTMLYLLCGRDVSELSRFPFAASELFGRFVPAADLFAAWHPDCRIYLPRCVSGFVGADISCAMLSAGLHEAQGALLLADVGTNGEIVLKHGARLLCCSTAAGPAFEGAGIERGSCAVSGAVDAVWQEAHGLGWHVLQGGPARSLCGSGALDLLACLIANGTVDESGLLACTDTEEGRPVYRLTDAVWLTQKDVRALQLAKAAIRAGIETLLLRADLRQPIDALYLSGGFGSRMHIESALAVGLLPPRMRGRVHAVGNAAGMGAVRLLLDRDALDVCAALAQSAESVPLVNDPVFAEQFIERMAFEESE